MQPYSDALRLSMERTSLNFHFCLANSTSFLKTNNVNIWGDDLSSDPLLAGVAEKLKPETGLFVNAQGPELVAAAPVIAQGAFLGTVSVGLSLSEAVKGLSIPAGFGMVMLLDKKYSGLVEREAAGQEAGRWLVLNSFAVDDSLLVKHLLEDELEKRSGSIFFSFIPIEDYTGERAGGIVMVYDSTLLHEIKRVRIYQLGGLFFAGAVLMWLFLYLNVVRIERFFRRLKKIIIASHSNDFGERFESDHIHCLDVMHCHNEECPVYKDPSLVCYLETGTEAISPRWRDTCIFLNKYEICANCPVYALRKGDELAEMRNVVNTMMRLWSNFLSRTGHLLAYVLRSQETTGQLPSLDEVANRLEQMAKLTFFSHDLQGTLDKDEVYQQLAHVFGKTFNLNRFVLFEVDHDSNRILIALDHTKGESLCKKEVLLTTEICRANRVAEDVFSFYNPKLCPYFSCNHDTEVRCCLPMVMGGHVGAVFSFLAPRNSWERIREMIPILRKYLDEAAPVLSSLRLLKLSKEQALRDPLTHCHNRRFLDEFISKYEPLSEREGKKTGFLMADLDYFKQVNDEYGHEAGDQVLRAIVTILQGCIRRSDLLIRYGGEEFLILLQDVKNGMSQIVAEKIRVAVEQHNFEVTEGIRIKKTISVGVAEYPEDANTLYKAIKFADVALYEAKNQGRNRVVRFLAEMWKGEEY